jgi:hypothetical protein
VLKLYCQICGTYCGQRPDEIVLRMAKGAEVEIVATCADCTTNGTDCTYNGSMSSIDDLLRQFGMKK